MNFNFMRTYNYLILPTGKGPKGVSREDKEVVCNLLKQMTQEKVHMLYGTAVRYYNGSSKPHHKLEEYYTDKIWGLIFCINGKGIDYTQLTIIKDLTSALEVNEIPKSNRPQKAIRIQ